MIETLKNLYEGQATIIKNKHYLSTMAYIKPFVERMDAREASYNCLVKVADQLSDDGTNTHTIYNRVLITALLPNTVNLNNHLYTRVLCMSYALDIKKPICKFYTGVIDEMYNFYAFGPDCISIQELEPDIPIDYTPIDTILKNGENDNCLSMIKQLEDIAVLNEQSVTNLGKWVEFVLKKEYINDSGKIKLSNTLPIDIYKKIYIDNEVDNDGTSIPILSIYRLFATNIFEDDKDLTNRYEKTQLINQMLKL